MLSCQYTFFGWDAVNEARSCRRTKLCVGREDLAVPSLLYQRCQRRGDVTKCASYDNPTGNDGNATQIHMNSHAFTRAFGVFLATTIAELLVCYLPVLWLGGKGSAWLLLPTALSLVVFVWLLTLHPDTSGRVYATYGAAYTATAIGWLYFIGDVV